MIGSWLRFIIHVPKFRGPSKKESWGPKTCKIWADFGQLQTLIASIFRMDQDIENRKLLYRQQKFATGCAAKQAWQFGYNFQGARTPRIWEGKNVQNIRFGRTLDFDCEYLCNRLRYWKFEKQVIQYIPFHWRKDLVNYGPLRKKFHCLILTHPKSTVCMISDNFGIRLQISLQWMKQGWQWKKSAISSLVHKIYWTSVHWPQSLVVSCLPTQN